MSNSKKFNGKEIVLIGLVFCVLFYSTEPLWSQARSFIGDIILDGKLTFKQQFSTNKTELVSAVPTNTNVITLPNKSGTIALLSDVGPGGSGDMTKVIYDTNDNGIVDTVEGLSSKLDTNGSGANLTDITFSQLSGTATTNQLPRDGAYLTNLPVTDGVTNIFSTDSNGLVPASGAFSSYFLRGDGTWQQISTGGGDAFLASNNIFTGTTNTFRPSAANGAIELNRTVGGGDIAINFIRGSGENLRIGAAAGGALFGGINNVFLMDLIGSSEAVTRNFRIRVSTNSGGSYSEILSVGSSGGRAFFTISEADFFADETQKVRIGTASDTGESFIVSLAEPHLALRKTGSPTDSAISFQRAANEWFRIGAGGGGTVFGGGNNTFYADLIATNLTPRELWYRMSTNNGITYQYLMKIKPQASGHGHVDVSGHITATNFFGSGVGLTDINFTNLTGTATTNQLPTIPLPQLQTSDATIGQVPMFTNSTVQWASVLSTNVPANTNSTGTPGTLAYSTNYLYLCVATNSWRRIPLSTW